MPVTRLRDIGPIKFGTFDSGSCANSATVTLDSEILRAKCGSAISERYQGITALSAEASVETNNPFVDIHPGLSMDLAIGIPGASPFSGIPDEASGVTLHMLGVVTGTVRRFSRNELATGTYTLRGTSFDGIDCPVFFSAYESVPPVSSADEIAGFIRDIIELTFEDVLTREDFCPESLEVTEASSLIEDSCQGELWPTYVGITGLNVSVTATGKGVVHGFTAGTGETTCLGKKGRIDIGVAAGSSVDCASIVPGGTGHVLNANVTSMTITATHGEIATISLSWTAHGSDGELADATKRAIFFIGS